MVAGSDPQKRPEWARPWLRGNTITPMQLDATKSKKEISEFNERGSTSEGAKMVPGFAETRFRMSDAVLRRTVDAAS